MSNNKRTPINSWGMLFKFDSARAEKSLQISHIRYSEIFSNISKLKF